MERISPQLEGGGTHGSRPLLSLARDERLTLEMRRGSQAAFEVAYRRHAPGMFALCRHILGSTDEAEEALQQSFAAAWSDLQRPDRPAPERLKPWLYALARHRCLSMVRSRRPSPVELEETPSTSGLAEEVGWRADLRALFADLRDLPEEQRTALVLSEISGMSHADIANVLGRRESGIKSLVFQARTTLGDWREAREAPCAEIREQLSASRGGALRRPLRRHLQACTSCREFRAELLAQRRRLAIVLPVLPAFGLKRSVLAAVGLGGASGGGAAGGGAAAGLAAGLAAPALALLGSATVATMAVVGTLSGGWVTDIEDERGKHRPRVLAHAPSAAGERASQRGGPQAADWRRRMPVRARQPNRSDLAFLAGSQPPGKRRAPAAPTPNAGGAPATAEEPRAHEGTPTAPANTEASPPQNAPAPTTAADREAVEKIARAERDAAEKIAQADQEAARKTATADRDEARKVAEADQEEARKVAEADRKAAGKGPAEQQKAEEAKARARQEADAKRAAARDEAANLRARSLWEAEQKKAKALEELAKKKADALAEAARKNAAAEEHTPRG